jgi:RsiW-degrading membrane proteinase PrsW (M82 family)
LLWGGTAAALGAQGLNDMALRVLPPALVSGFLGPVVEELAKGTALIVVILVWPGGFTSVRDGIVFGALAGLGFAATENLGYYTIAAVQGGTTGLMRALYLRGLLQGLNHAAFSAILGAAIGAVRSGSAQAIPILVTGFAAAVAAHAAWNWIASPAITDILCNAPTPAAACAPAPDRVDMLLAIPALVATFFAPIAALLTFLARRRYRD